ncbi:MAG: efflux transporter periplasmic adaptor subunit [Gammaproteobacteria bacterium]|jgi:multidrug efflux system membrane fusion protein|nr:efflux transporter periplasmic adaptor subunit [Gammaproteobacteria bacterium]
MISHRKYVVCAAIVALAAAGLGVFITSRSHAVIAVTGAGSDQAIEVDVAQVTSRIITDYQSYFGRTEAINRVEIRPLVPGTIVGVHFSDGALVNTGDLLFTIDQRPYKAAVDRASGELAAARARNGYASTDASRAERLLADNAIARREYDQAQNAAREALANVLSAQAVLEVANVNLSYTRIIAPVAGRASRAEWTLGNVVSTGASAPILTTVVSISPIYASFDVDEQTYLRYLSGDSRVEVPVFLGLANESGYSREGKVSSIDNQLDTGSGTIRVRALFENKDRSLVPGLYARIKVGGGAPHAAVLVISAAIGTDQDKNYVMVMDSDHRVRYREVALGAERDGMTVISAGLKPGETIVVNGLQRVRSNDIVRPHAVEMMAALNALESES